MTSRERRVLAVTAILAIGAPVSAAWWIAARTDELAEELSTAGGVRARIGTVDADLSGAVRLSDVAIGELFAAGAVEASVGMGSLLDGQLRADEIRVERPHLAISIDPDGDSDLARWARRLRQARPKSSGARSTRTTQVRRIVVADGTLVARIAGLGEIAADDVELIPDTTGLRVVTGPLRVRADDASRHLHLDLTFTRSAAEVSQQMKFGRVLAVGGTGTATTSGARLALYDLAAGRRVAGGPLEIFAATDDNGIARNASLEIHPRDFTIVLRGDRFPLRAFAQLAPPGLDLVDTRATGTLTLERRPRGAYHLAADATLDRLVVADPRVAVDAVPLSFQIEAGIDVTPDAITVPDARIRLDSVELQTSGWVRRGKPTSGQLELEVPRTSCQALLDALPAPIRGPLDGMELTGRLGTRLRLTVDLAAPEGEGTTLTNALDGACQVIAEPPAANVTVLAKKDSLDQQVADGTRLRIGPGEPTWAALKSLPWYVPGAFTSAEDGRFWEHGGFDLHQIARSLEIDLREHRLARGGSTISQQLVKNVFLSLRRSFDRKLQEAILTWRLESKLTKKQILERYLNSIELGPRVFGLRPAAKYWFNVSPRELTVRQAAFLAGLTSQPTSMARRIRKTGGTDPETKHRITIVLMAMRRDGVIDEATFIDALNQRLWFAATAVPPDR